MGHRAPQKAQEPTGGQVRGEGSQEAEALDIRGQHPQEGLGFQTQVVLLPTPGVAQGQAWGRKLVLGPLSEKIHFQ